MGRYRCAVNRIMENNPKTMIASVDRVSAFLYKDNRLEDSEYATTNILLKDIFMPVKPKKNLALQDSLMVAGMKNPLIVLTNTQKNYDMAIRGIRPDLVEERTSASFLCYAGNQRMVALQSLGYKMASCILADDVHWAHAIHLVLEEGKIVNESS